MKEILTPEIVSLIITAFIVPIITYFIDKGFNYATTKSKNETLKQYIEHAENAVITAVASVSQTYVENLKKSDIFDEAAHKKAFEMAKQTALSIIGDDAKSAVNAIYKDFNKWLENSIEFYVNSKKTHN